MLLMWKKCSPFYINMMVRTTQYDAGPVYAYQQTGLGLIVNHNNNIYNYMFYHVFSFVIRNL